MALKHFECLLYSRHCAKCWAIKDEREMISAIKKFTAVQGKGEMDKKTDHWAQLRHPNKELFAQFYNIRKRTN